MEQISQYLVSLICAAILSGIIISLLGKTGTQAAVGKLLCGIFLTITLLRPWASVQLDAFGEYLTAFSSDAEILIEQALVYSDDAQQEIIKAEVESYILDKAASLEVEITVNVELQKSQPQIPCAVTIYGAVSPSAKASLQQMLEEELGIPKEAQQWIG